MSPALRLIGMSSQTQTERNFLELLQTEYRRSWHGFTVAVETLQSALGDPNATSDSVKSARASVEIAVREYREARNSLAEHLLENGNGSAHDLAMALANSQAA
jgi:hypothetical protein